MCPRARRPTPGVAYAPSVQAHTTVPSAAETGLLHRQYGTRLAGMCGWRTSDAVRVYAAMGIEVPPSLFSAVIASAWRIALVTREVVWDHGIGFRSIACGLDPLVVGSFAFISHAQRPREASQRGVAHAYRHWS